MLRRSQWMWIAIAGSGALWAGGLRTQESAPATPVSAPGVFRREYILTPGDQVEVVVRRVPEASRTVVIRPDGFLSLPLADEIEAAGLTVMQLKLRITEILAKRLVDPEVSVIALQTRQPVVYVLGDVNVPGPVPLRNASTAIQAVAVAGGLRRTGEGRKVVIIRVAEDGTLKAIPLDVKTRRQEEPLLAMQSIPTRPDDVIFVPESGRSRFARFLDDFLNRPLQSVNGVVGTYVNFRFIEILNRSQ